MTHAPRLRIGIIGLGLITQSRHLPNLLQREDLFEITRVCDLSAEVSERIAAASGGAAWSTDAADVIEDPDVDAVLLCTPGAHSALARRALEAGKHVFAEKPYAYAPEVAIADAQYAAANGLVLQVGYMKMYEPAVAIARDLYDRIGPIRLARMTVLHPSDENQTSSLRLVRGRDVATETLATAVAENAHEVADALRGRGGVDPKLVRNVLFGSVCHDVALLRELFPGQVATPVSAIADAPSAERTEPPRLQITGVLDGGPRWALSWNWLADYPEYREWVEIFGDRGSIHIELPAPYGGEPTAVVRATWRGENGIEEATIRPGAPDAFERELVEFAASIRDGGPIRSDAVGAARDSEMLLRIAEMLID